MKLDKRSALETSGGSGMGYDGWVLLDKRNAFYLIGMRGRIPYSGRRVPVHM